MLRITSFLGTGLLFIGMIGAPSCSDKAQLDQRSKAASNDRRDNDPANEEANAQNNSTQTDPSQTEVTTGVMGQILLHWDRYTEHPEADFRIYIRSGDSNEADLLAEVSHTSQGFDADSPQKALSLTESAILKGLAGQEGCFTITAVIDDQESTPSQAKCIKLGAD